MIGLKSIVPMKSVTSVGEIRGYTSPQSRYSPVWSAGGRAHSHIQIVQLDSRRCQRALL
jgi:hypothetical protein